MAGVGLGLADNLLKRQVYGRAADRCVATAKCSNAMLNLAVSPWTTTMSSMGMPSASAAIWENVVSAPCPWGDVPVMTATLPVASTLTVALSHPPGR